jgi:hypothetical protein
VPKVLEKLRDEVLADLADIAAGKMVVPDVGIGPTAAPAVLNQVAALDANPPLWTDPQRSTTQTTSLPRRMYPYRPVRRPL